MRTQKKPIRTVQAPSGTQKEQRIAIPKEMNVENQDVMLFERVDEKTVKMIKIA